ncbi:unnamed protein product [Adineta ricciae]|uniref:Uncharacterized protein n=1 Tax=Adineta ricciae TaxID=249248 RepID=A0A815SLZ0_ADIRI|nr:unnamed protein product [Adineta ricciae]
MTSVTQHSIQRFTVRVRMILNDYAAKRGSTIVHTYIQCENRGVCHLSSSISVHATVSLELTTKIVN